MGRSIKETLNLNFKKKKNPGSKYPGNLGYFEKTTLINNKYIEVKRNSDQRHRRYL